MEVRATSRNKTDFDHEMVWGTIGLVILLAARFFPFEYVHLPRCVFLAITGRPCVSCGMTRCFIAMSRFHLAAAWRINPLGAVLFVATACYVIYAAVVVIAKLPRIRIKCTSRWEVGALIAAAFLIVAANWTYLVLTWR